MKYADLPAGASVFVDAGPFIHHFEYNDALIIAAMRSHGLNCLASADSDFDRVPGITRYAPA